MTGAESARRIREAGLTVPVVLLAFDNRELKDFLARYDVSGVERIFLWQGDARILLAIVKSVEDWRNVAHDTQTLGVQVIILIEDNIRYYSSFLPTIYGELLHHSQRLIQVDQHPSRGIGSGWSAPIYRRSLSPRREVSPRSSATASETSRPLASMMSSSSSGVRVSWFVLALGLTAFRSKFLASIAERSMVQLCSLLPRVGNRLRNSSKRATVNGVFFPTLVSERS